jgi:hypothetical protein
VGFEFGGLAACAFGEEAEAGGVVAVKDHHLFYYVIFHQKLNCSKTAHHQNPP